MAKQKLKHRIAAFFGARSSSSTAAPSEAAEGPASPSQSALSTSTSRRSSERFSTRWQRANSGGQGKLRGTPVISPTAIPASNVATEDSHTRAPPEIPPPDEAPSQQHVAPEYQPVSNPPPGLNGIKRSSSFDDRSRRPIFGSGDRLLSTEGDTYWVEGLQEQSKTNGLKVILESRSELLQTQDQNPRHAEYNAAWKTNGDASVLHSNLRTASAPDGLRSMLTAMQVGSPSTGYDSGTSQGTREQLSLSEQQRDDSSSPDQDSSPTLTSDRNTGPSQTPSIQPATSAASSLEGVRERAEAVLRDAESILKQESGWAAEAPQTGRPGASPQPSQEAVYFSSSQELRPMRNSNSPEDLRPYGSETVHPAPQLEATDGREAGHGQPPPGRGLTDPQDNRAVGSHAARLQHLSPDGARGAKDSPSGITRAASPTRGEQESTEMGPISPMLARLHAHLTAGSLDLRASAAERLFNLSAEDEGAQIVLSSPGGIRALIELLYENKERGRMYAAYALSSVVSPPGTLERVYQAGAVPALIHVLNTSRVLASKKGAMRALGRLARHDAAAVEIASNAGLPPLVALLDCEDASLVRRCLVTLYFVGADKELLQTKIMNAGAIPTIVRLCASTHGDVQAEAADVLKVLSRNAAAGKVIIDADGLLHLDRVILQGRTDRAKASANKAVVRLAAIPELAEAVRNSPAGNHLQCADIAPATASAVLAGSGEANGFLDRLAAHEPGWERTQTQARPYQTMPEPGRLQPSQTPQPRESVPGPGVVESLMEMLQQGSVQNQVYAAQAVSKLALDSQACHALLASGVVPQLLGIIASETPAAGQAAATLERFAATSAGVDALGQPDAILAILTALNSSSRDIHAPLARLLCHSCSKHAPSAQAVTSEGGMNVLTRCCCHGSAEVRLSLLSLMRDLVRARLTQLTSGAVAVLGMLQHSHVAEVRALAASTCLCASRDNWEQGNALQAEQSIQASVSGLVAKVRLAVAISPLLEEAFRIMPRSLTLPPNLGRGAWACEPIGVSEAGVVSGHPQTEALALQALSPEEGQSFLDIGSGTGFVTLLAAHLVGSTGTSIGVELRPEAAQYAQQRLAQVEATRALSCGFVRFLQGNVFGHPQVQSLGPFDRIFVGADAPKARLRNLLRLLKRGGKMAVPVDGQLLLLSQPVEGPVPEPIVLGPAQKLDILLDAPDPMPMTPALGRASSRPFSSSAIMGTNGNGSTDTGFRVVPSPSQSPSDTIANSRTSSCSDRSSRPRPGLLQHVRQTFEGHRSHSADSGPSNHSAEQEDAFTAAGHGEWLISLDDIRIVRNAEGKKCRLGEGGFGIVYKALMNGVDEVAVKLVKADTPSPQEMSAFRKEVRVLRQLHHRNIVQFYGACLEPGSMFFVTELMKGGDLYSALRFHPETMRWDRLGRKVALDVALGINYLHTRRPAMMHRDLKSPNVLLSEEGVAKIADVAMVRTQAGQEHLISAQPIMTPLWAAPEVVRHERAGIKADMWSFGILVWELVSGMDITDMQSLAITRQMKDVGDAKVLDLPSVCPPVAARIFNECTKMHPDARPSAQTVVEWLRAT
ncbi:hypothetical protein WJX84_000788 [Apatococcus fuscideae]|uniref:Protein kinase domain-containing protein n=1 Tax=Apatococcus fuscideae TaxID=2026836 RepID=A0AAW1T1Q2_9CHLO